MEHWLPLFHDRLAALFDYLPGAVVTLDPLVDDARAKRLEQIADHYDARAQALERKAFGAPPYHPVPPEACSSAKRTGRRRVGERQTIALDPFEHPKRRGDEHRFLRRQAGTLLRRWNGRPKAPTCSTPWSPRPSNSKAKASA